MPSIPLSLVLPDFVSRLFVPLQLRGKQHRASFKLAPDRTIDNAVCVCAKSKKNKALILPISKHARQRLSLLKRARTEKHE
jgi:hypothetical protein